MLVLCLKCPQFIKLNYLWNIMSVISRIKKVCVYFFSGVILLLLLIWGASFIVLPWQVNKQLEPLELSLHSDASLSFNPFTLHIQIDDFAIVDKSSVNQLSLKHAHFNLSWLDVLSKQVVIEKAAIESLHVNIVRNDKKLFIGGIDLSADESLQVTIEEETTSKDPLAVIKGWRLLMPNFSFSDIALNINDQGQLHKIILNTFVIDALNASLDDASVNISLDAVINSSTLKVQSNINAILNENMLASATIANQLDITNFALQDWQYLLPLDDNQVSNLAGLINISITQDITLDNNKWQLIQPKFLLALNGINVIKPELELLNESFVFELNNLAVNGLDADLIDASGEAKLMVAGVNVTANGDTLATLSELSLSMVTFSVDDTFSAVANIPNITFKDILFSKPTDIEHALYSNDEFVINNISWQENHLAIDTINLGNFNTHVILNAEKQLKNLVSIEQTEVASTPEQQPDEQVTNDKTTEGHTEETAQIVTFSLNKFELISPSNITFIDESVTPVFKQDIALNKVVVSKVDSRNKTYMSPFDVAMSLGDHATNTIAGTIAPFNEKMNMTLDVNLSELSLPPLSSYLRTVLGVDFLSGQLDNTVKLAIKNDKMDGETVIGLRGFELASGDDTTDLSVSTGSAMGLNTALGMLKDDQGNVSLDVPLSGNINDPSFGIGSVLTLVAKKAIMSKAKSYLINTFVPYANVLTVASIAGEYLLRVEVNDLEYTAGQVTLNEQQQLFLNEFAALLKDRPEQQVKMCSIASIDEEKTLTGINTDSEKITLLKSISKKRGDNLKNILIKEYEIASSRLLLCAPRVEKSKGGLPRIEFSF